MDDVLYGVLTYCLLLVVITFFIREAPVVFKNEEPKSSPPRARTSVQSPKHIIHVSFNGNTSAVRTEEQRNQDIEDIKQFVEASHHLAEPFSIKTERKL